MLAKIFGFFTIRMNNTLDKKAPMINLDVLVMEHLFYGQNIVRVGSMDDSHDKR